MPMLMRHYLSILLLLSGAALGEPIQAPIVDGVQSVVVGTAQGQATWFVIRSYAPAPHGGFIEFEDKDNTGKWVSSAWLNGGTLVGTAPLQGDIDLGIAVDGKPVIISVAGRWQGGNPGIGVSQPDLMYIGSEGWAFAGISLTHVPCPGNIPGNPKYCVRMSGGFTPVY